MPKNSPTITGLISMHRRGFGFVKPQDAPTIQEVFIPRGQTMGAITGDVVKAKIRPSTKGFEGQVVEVLKRGRSELVGVVVNASEKEARVHVPLLGQEAVVSARLTKHEVVEGDRISLRVGHWGEDSKMMQADVSKTLGNIKEARTDIPYAVREQNIRTRFPKAVTEAINNMPPEITAADRLGRLDLREMESITIDPATAKDFDDALYVEKDAKGRYHLWVHIADVSHYVERGTPLDLEAQKRGNSTYFPGKCVPMLPPALADNLCSLKPGVDRLTATIRMQFDLDGSLIDYEIKRSVIQSKHRFTYEEAKKVFDGKQESPYAPMLHTMVELCGLLKKQRRLRGSVEFALPEVVVSVNRLGDPVGTHLVEYDITHQLVEEFMLKANEIVATHLTSSNWGTPYRVHEHPSEENLMVFRQLASAFGFHLPSSPSLQDIQTLFDQALQTSSGEFLAIAYIRSMKQAAYSPNNVGHYGLSLEHYCHFTSPIRRYADLVVHRILFGDRYTDKELDAISTHVSEKERISARAEDTVLRFKKLRLLNQWHSTDAHRSYEAIVTRATGGGIAFELPTLMLGGFLPLSQLDQDYYLFNERRQELRGQDFGGVFTCGTKIEVGVTMVDLIFGETSWHLISEAPRRRRRKKRK